MDLFQVVNFIINIYKYKYLNQIHLVYKYSDNFKIYDSIFQDQSTGFLIEDEPNYFLSFLSNLFTCGFSKNRLL